MSEIREASFRTPWGLGKLALKGDRLVRVDLPVPQGSLTPPAGEMSAGASSLATARPGLKDDALGYWRGELEAYFAGGRREWSAEELYLEQLEVSDFAKRVYRALLTVPAGETVSYGELAAMAGHPRAARAVGSAMAANPLSIVVPCHRVVRSDGSAGHYGECDDLKPYLLGLEGAW